MGCRGAAVINPKSIPYSMVDPQGWASQPELRMCARAECGSESVLARPFPTGHYDAEKGCWEEYVGKLMLASLVQGPPACAV